MTTYIMNLEDYKYFFKEDTEITEDIDFIQLKIDPIKNPDDKAWTYSIKWENMDNEENGEIKKINWKSHHALKSCEWAVEDEDSEDEENNVTKT